MIECTTRAGFTCKLDENVMNNMELVDIMADNSMNAAFCVSAAAKLILGPVQKKQLYDHLRTEDGRVPIEKVEEAITDIFHFFGQQGKNS